MLPSPTQTWYSHGRQCLPDGDTSLSHQNLKLKHVQQWTYLFLVFSRFVMHLPNSPSQTPDLLESHPFLLSNPFSKQMKKTQKMDPDFSPMLFPGTLCLYNLIICCFTTLCPSLKCSLGWQCLLFSLLLSML